MLSPSCLDKVEETVEITTSHPLQALINDFLFLKSPSAKEHPIFTNAAIFSDDEVFLTNASYRFLLCCKLAADLTTEQSC
jgi:hypothetical protein